MYILPLPSIFQSGMSEWQISQGYRPTVLTLVSLFRMRMSQTILIANSGRTLANTINLYKLNQAWSHFVLRLSNGITCTYIWGQYLKVDNSGNWTRDITRIPYRIHHHHIHHYYHHNTNKVIIHHMVGSIMEKNKIKTHSQEHASVR